MQHAFIKVVELLDSVPFHQVPEEIVLGSGYLRVLDCPELAGCVIAQGIDIQPQVFGKQFSEGFQYPALKLGVVLLVKEVLEVGHPHGHCDRLCCVSC